MIKFITQNFSIKIFSLFVALVLFLFVNVESVTPVDVDLPIEYRTAQGLVVTGETPMVLHVTLQGPWAAFRVFNHETLMPVVIDIRDTTVAGTLRYEVQLGAVHAPAGMRVVAVHPADLAITLDREDERWVPVSADILEHPAVGYGITDVRIEPPRVRVVGPVDRITDIGFVNTGVIDVSGRRDDVILDVALRPPPPPLHLRDTHVRVHVAIHEE